jgi:hypothetical protein
MAYARAHKKKATRARSWMGSGRRDLPGESAAGAQDPDSFSRFCKWAKTEVRLNPTHLKQLRRAHELAIMVARARNAPAPTGEFALRPLWWRI